MAILVTGAAGFAALNIVEHLLASGRDVVGLDRVRVSPHGARFLALPGRFTLIGGSILSSADLSRALLMYKDNDFIHIDIRLASSAAA